jgi:hypothetical protein
MSGGNGKKHSHPGSLRVLSLQRYKSFPGEVRHEDRVFDNLQNEAGKVEVCATTCLMYGKGRCGSTGKKAPIDNYCEAQLISRRER